jgi:tRNA (mo5U34)-methyltransferase
MKMPAPLMQSTALNDPGTTPEAGTKTLDRNTLARRIGELGEWFHNLNLHGVPTAPDHFLGDFPNIKWKHVARHIPADLQGATVLDVGCNAGFYSLEMKRRGASRVLGIDVDDRYLAQARFASDTLGLEIELEKRSVYDVDQIPGQFDFVLFMGVMYHLRYPLYALDKIANKVRGRLVFQTMVRGAERPHRWEKNYHFWEKDIFHDPSFPCMYFIEESYAGDPTNWWIPNSSAAEALLRSAGMEIEAHPEEEIWIGHPVNVVRSGSCILDLELAGLL